MIYDEIIGDELSKKEIKRKKEKLEKWWR